MCILPLVFWHFFALIYPTQIVVLQQVDFSFFFVSQPPLLEKRESALQSHDERPVSVKRQLLIP